MGIKANKYVNTHDASRLVVSDAILNVKHLQGCGFK